jgi:hypothetical protein
METKIIYSERGINPLSIFFLFIGIGGVIAFKIVTLGLIYFLVYSILLVSILFYLINKINHYIIYEDKVVVFAKITKKERDIILLKISV